MTDVPGYVVLGKNKTDNSYKAIIERSFSMDLSDSYCCFFWSGGYFDLDGATQYRDCFSKDFDMVFEIFDVYSDDLPILIDWEAWKKANEPADTLSEESKIHNEINIVLEWGKMVSSPILQL